MLSVEHEGFILSYKEEDINELQSLVRTYKVRKVELNVTDPEWKNCYFYIQKMGDDFILYLWPQSWLTFKSKVDGFVSYVRDIYEVALFITQTEKVLQLSS